MSDQREQLNEMKQFMKIAEGGERPYVCHHNKKGEHECKADSSYGAAKKAAEHWGLDSTAGVSATLTDVKQSTQFVGEEDFPAQGSEQECAWWAGCNNEATTTEPHPVLGAVPICDRCADKLRKMDEGDSDGKEFIDDYESKTADNNPCMYCDGEDDDCEVCHGKDEMFEVGETSFDDYGAAPVYEADAECDRCCGTGRHPSRPEDCPECHGSGNCPKVDENINLDSIVESVLSEYDGQPKDYEVSDDELDTEVEDKNEIDKIDPNIEDEELGLRFD